LRHLMRLVDDLLDVERLAHGKISLHRERLHLADILDVALERCGPHLDEDSCEIKVTTPDAPLVIFGDSVRLLQVFANLIENAFKFTPPGGKIEVIAQRDGVKAKVVVKDTGIGMEPDLLMRLFDLYTQGQDDNTREQPGLGLGLALVRQLVEMHGGTVTASSEGIDKGSTFTISLPLATEEQGYETSTAAKREPQDATTGSKKRVLTVEDNRDSADAMVLLLNGFGHTAEAAYNGVNALEAAQEFNPDVAIIDIGLPGIDGFEVARHMRETLPHVVRIALSGWKIDSNDSRARNFDHFFIKPFDPQELERLIFRL
jgi:CheY-like chemotaxis protein